MRKSFYDATYMLMVTLLIVFLLLVSLFLRQRTEIQSMFKNKHPEAKIILIQPQFPGQGWKIEYVDKWGNRCRVLMKSDGEEKRTSFRMHPPSAQRPSLHSR